MRTLHLNIKADILGSEYRIMSATESEEPRLIGKNGFTDWTSRLICLERNFDGDLDSAKAFMEKVIRHELIHAFMFESGFGECMEHNACGQEETVIDWFAFQMPKIMKTVDAVFMKAVWEET